MKKKEKTKAAIKSNQSARSSIYYCPVYASQATDVSGCAFLRKLHWYAHTIQQILLQICRIFISGISPALLKKERETKWLGLQSLQCPFASPAPQQPCQGKIKNDRRKTVGPAMSIFHVFFQKDFVLPTYPASLHSKASSTQLWASFIGVFAVHFSLPKEHQRNRHKDQCGTPSSVYPSLLSNGWAVKQNPEWIHTQDSHTAIATISFWGWRVSLSRYVPNT